MSYSDYEAWAVREIEKLESKLAAAEAELARLYGDRSNEQSLVLDWVSVAGLGDALAMGVETGAWINSQGDTVMECVEHLGEPSLFVGSWEKYLDRDEALAVVRALLFWRRNRRLPSGRDDE